MSLVEDSPVAVETALSTRAQKREPLYAGRARVYPKRVAGTFRRIKWIALVVLLGIYYAAPWLRWDRGAGVPDQAFLIDMANRRAYFLWLEIWPQEVYFLMGLLILAAFGLFLATSLFGRVWCGYACPQTVWTDLFMWVERLVEGDRNARIKLDQGPLTLTKAWRKAAKHGAWLVIAALTGGAWIMYFNDAPTVVVQVLTGAASAMVYFFFGLFTATTYVLAGWAREQVCTYMCPWPRFQGAMFDEDTLVVTYQRWRGEPRGKHKRGQTWEGRGHCVDCNQCVAVCPTGIDIRDGSQLECIGCGLCVDACASVMDKVDLPRGLITFDTEANQRARAQGAALRYRLLRPRTIIYGLLLLVAGAFMAVGLATRASIDVTVQHERNPMFVKLSDGSIRNDYTVKIVNKHHDTRAFALGVPSLPGARLWAEGEAGGPSGYIAIDAQPATVTAFRIHVVLTASATPDQASQPVAFILTDLGTGEVATHESIFVSPER